MITTLEAPEQWVPYVLEDRLPVSAHLGSFLTGEAVREFALPLHSLNKNRYKRSSNAWASKLCFLAGSFFEPLKELGICSQGVDEIINDIFVFQHH